MPAPRQINNPLTLIGVFAGISEVAGTAVLTQIDGAVQLIFVWFVMLFPVLLVVLFFYTLITKPQVIYGPSDYRDESNFVSIIRESYRAPTEDGDLIRAYWRPGGTVDRQHEARLRRWLADKSLANNSITLFLTSDRFRDARSEAVAELGLRD